MAERVRQLRHQPLLIHTVRKSGLAAQFLGTPELLGQRRDASMRDGSFSLFLRWVSSAAIRDDFLQLYVVPSCGVQIVC